MPTDEERLQALKDQETEDKLFTMLDKYFETRKPKQEENDGSQRTKNEKTGFLDTLFG